MIILCIIGTHLTLLWNKNKPNSCIIMLLLWVIVEYDHRAGDPGGHTPHIHTQMQMQNANHLAATCTKWSRSPGRARMPVH